MTKTSANKATTFEHDTRCARCGGWGVGRAVRPRVARDRRRSIEVVRVPGAACAGPLESRRLGRPVGPGCYRSPRLRRTRAGTLPASSSSPTLSSPGSTAPARSPSIPSASSALASTPMDTSGPPCSSLAQVPRVTPASLEASSMVSRRFRRARPRSRPKAARVTATTLPGGISLGMGAIVPAYRWRTAAMATVGPLRLSPGPRGGASEIACATGARRCKWWITR